ADYALNEPRGLYAVVARSDTCRGMCKRAILAGAVALFALSIAAVPAWAAHPGANGLIAFIRQVDGHYHSLHDLARRHERAAAHVREERGRHRSGVVSGWLEDRLRAGSRERPPPDLRDRARQQRSGDEHQQQLNE